MARQHRASKSLHHLPLTLMVGVGVVLSIFAFRAVRNNAAMQLAMDFERAASDRVMALERELESSMHELESIGGFFAGSHRVERDEFRAFVRSFLSHSPGIQALEWIPRVKDSQRAAYEEAARQEGYPDFQITDRARQGQMVRADQRDEYFPVYYVEPYAGNERALGFDPASNPARLEALTRARDTGRMVATARITLVQETGDQFGFLVFLPIYFKGTAIDSIEGRRENLQGFALGVFRVGDIVDKALTYLEPEAIDVHLDDLTAPVGQRLLHFHPSRRGEAPAAPPTADQQALLRTAMHHVARLDVAGRTWAVTFTPGPDFTAAHGVVQPWWVLVIGLFITVLVAGYSQQVVSHSDKLSKANESLQHEISERLQAKTETSQLTEVIESRSVELEHRAEELVQANRELERFNRLAVGRELRMIELKRRVNELAKQAGKSPPYDLSFADSQHPGGRTDDA